MCIQSLDLPPHDRTICTRPKRFVWASCSHAIRCYLTAYTKGIPLTYNHKYSHALHAISSYDSIIIILGHALQKGSELIRPLLAAALRYYTSLLAKKTRYPDSICIRTPYPLLANTVHESCVKYRPSHFPNLISGSGLFYAFTLRKFTMTTSLNAYLTGRQALI